MSGKPQNNKRVLSLAGWLKLRYPDGERISWDDLWLNQAELVAYRGRCSRDRVGAVIVDPENRMLSVGYNGPPAGFDVDGPCSNWCPRAINGPSSNEYDDCYALHAELNALLTVEKRPINGGSIYVTSAICWRCATMVANSGLTRVVMRVIPREHRHRNVEKTISYLTECGVEVVAVRAGESSGYRAIYMREYGYGPHPCHFCDVPMPWPEAIHHLDGDHSNNAVDNLTASHSSCHANYHKAVNPVGWIGGPRYTITGNFTRRKPKLACRTCGLETTPGWLKRHALELGHDGSAYDEWRESTDREIELGKADRKIESEARQRRRCECGLVTKAGPMAKHLRSTKHQLITD